VVGENLARSHDLRSIYASIRNKTVDAGPLEVLNDSVRDVPH
jgi:hypothetical protein